MICSRRIGNTHHSAHQWSLYNHNWDLNQCHFDSVRQTAKHLVLRTKPGILAVNSSNVRGIHLVDHLKVEKLVNYGSLHEKTKLICYPLTVLNPWALCTFGTCRVGSRVHRLQVW